tara:strand:- start:1231 stop:1398 length:168 start_codon:yes stop_codon:yes gene_type:complete
VAKKSESRNLELHLFALHVFAVLSIRSATLLSEEQLGPRILQGLPSLTGVSVCLS